MIRAAQDCFNVPHCDISSVFIGFLGIKGDGVGSIQ